MVTSWAVGVEAERSRALRVMGVSRESIQPEAPQTDEYDDSIFASAKSALRHLLTIAQPSSAQLRNASNLSLLVAALLLISCISFRAPLVLLGMPCIIVCVLAWLKRRAFRRAEAFERDYPALLLALASSVRTGLDPLVAMQRARELFPATSEVARELNDFAQRIEAGMTEEQAISRFGETIAHPDIRLFQTAFLLARKEGSSLAGCLHRLARVTRNRQSFRRKVKTAIAMQKLSSFGIAGCALIIVGIQALMNFEALRSAAVNPVGSRMLIGGLLLMLIGLVAMLRMSRARI